MPVLAGYFALMALQLSVFTPSGYLDDSVVLLDAQSFEWGYDPKSPPLFIWLARTAMLVTGPQIETIFALRMACLFSFYAGLLGVARKLQPDPLLALGAGLAMLATIHFHWYFLWKYTNTTLALAVMPYAVLGFLRLARHRTVLAYGLFGFVSGLGLLSRYHFAILLVALLGAAAFSEKWRPVICDRRMLLAVSLAGVLVAPHVSWYLAHWPELAAQVPGNVGFDPAADRFAAAAKGLGNLAEETISIFLFPLGVLMAGLMWPAFRPALVEDPDREADLVLVRNMLFGLAGIMVLVAILGLTRIRTRHLFFFSFLPLWLIARLDRSRLPAFAAPGFAVALGLCVASAALGFGLQSWEYAGRCIRCEKALPFDTYARAIRAAGFDGGTIILSPSLNRGALLRSYFPNAFVAAPLRFRGQAPALAGPPKKDCLYVWKADPDDAVLADLRRGAVVPGPDLPLPSHAVFGGTRGKVHLTGQPTYLVRFVLVKGGLGNCH